MTKHVLSFIRSPLGYLFNLLATLAVYAGMVPGLGWVDRHVGAWLTGPCERFCARDGIQDDMLF